jgi:polysaccharide export outer membrane protein
VQMRCFDGFRITATLALFLAVLSPNLVAQQTARAILSADTGPARVPPSPSVLPSYIIGPEDVLQISVWKEPEISATIPVRPDGRISLPLLSDLQAAGLTPTQLAASVTSGLHNYIADPRVTVVVAAVNSQHIYITGEVHRAGVYPLHPNTTVLQALSDAGGFTEFANIKSIYILRNENGQPKRYPFNYRRALKGQDLSENMILQTDDTIVVP